MTKPHKSMYEDWIHKQRIASDIFLNHIITIPNKLISDIKIQEGVLEMWNESSPENKTE